MSADFKTSSWSTSGVCNYASVNILIFELSVCVIADELIFKISNPILKSFVSPKKIFYDYISDFKIISLLIFLHSSSCIID